MQKLTIQEGQVWYNTKEKQGRPSRRPVGCLGGISLLPWVRKGWDGVILEAAAMCVSRGRRNNGKETDFKGGVLIGPLVSAAEGRWDGAFASSARLAPASLVDFRCC
mmetsp:Transcript_23963/g.48505  ORF Transcript_23963/g.48505 Transcript_23963/m.48505 type:complete len:107 (-) Transcript_23963:278-598(-)